MKQIIPADQLERWLICDADNGRLFFKPRPAESFASRRAFSAWHVRFSGKEAFRTMSAEGYKKGLLFGVKYYAHRVIWAMSNGQWPDMEIDHIDGNPSNNALSNLRPASRSENNKNVASKKPSSSRYQGVSWISARNKWGAYVSDNGRTVYVGLFPDEIEAAVARDKKAAELYGSFARMNFPHIAE